VDERFTIYRASAFFISTIAPEGTEEKRKNEE
jgi:hypothetical protein